MLTNLSPQRRRLALMVSGASAVLLVVVVGVVVAGAVSGGAKVVPVDQAVAGPVIVVPGYGGSTSAPDVLAAKLQKAGRTATVLTLPDGGTGDIAAQAKVLAAAVAATGAPSVDLVGYSAGGVVVRYYVKELGGGSHVRRVVTLGSPQHGTALAAVGATFATNACPTACQQLEPGSSLLKELNAGDETPAGPTWVSLWTTDDTTVTPPTSASLAGAVDIALQGVCASENVSHSDLPRDPLVAGIVLAAIGPGLTAVPPASECDSLTAAGA